MGLNVGRRDMIRPSARNRPMRRSIGSGAFLRSSTNGPCRQRHSKIWTNPTDHGRGDEVERDVSVVLSTVRGMSSQRNGCDSDPGISSHRCRFELQRMTKWKSLQSLAGRRLVGANPGA